MMRRLVVVLALLICVMGATATAASAHTELLKSNPADGSTLSSVPAVITLTFNEPVLDQGASIVAKAADGTAIRLDAVTVADAEVGATWPQTAGEGRYTISWRAVADDGHPVTGSFVFTIAGASPTPTPTSTPTASPTSTPTASPTDTATPTPTAAPTPTPAPTPTEAPAVATGTNRVPALIGAVVVFALVGTLIAFLIRRRGQS